ncbi:MAG: 50S ribosomal protein L13 [Chloroflexi bacterium]|nr:50S ribosomal protein L13 [Chloroflexota bacterium]
MATATNPKAAPEWHVVDAEGKTLGRVSSEISTMLMGKHKPAYVPYLHSGDFVVVVNAEKVVVTGKKLEQKMYYRYSGYHGGLKEQNLATLLDKRPGEAITRAVKGMLPKSRLGKQMIRRLKVYGGPDHPHEAQINASK